jgi:flavin-dependent dehydrogenase
MPSPIHISGAGPAGLAAAITIAGHGGRAVVHERYRDVGMRFHGDFQGLESWAAEGDVLDELQSIGIEPTFEHTPIRKMTIFDPAGSAHQYRSPHPIFYLVRRGPYPGTLDASLKDQALACGAEIRFRDRLDDLPAGGIAAHGPSNPDAIAVGYVFDTDMADGVVAAASDLMAPKGYAYLLVDKGRGTVATMMFRDYRAARICLERTVEFFTRKAGLRMKNERRFGGFGSLGSPQAGREVNILFVGEAGGFQDALWGFGLRYAMLSGHLAAKAALRGSPEVFGQLWKERLGGALKAGHVNRFLFQKLGDAGYPWLLRLFERRKNFREWLRLYYGFSFWKRFAYPLVCRTAGGGRRGAA